MKLQNFPDLFEKAKPSDGDTFDLRFEEAVSLVEQDQFDEATPLIEAILNEGSLDIRLIMHLFYAHFLKEGVESFLTTFPYIFSLIGEHWEKLSPITRRESHASKSVVWFVSSLGKRMKRSSKVHKENRPDALWTRTLSLSTEKLEEIEALIGKMMQFFTNDWKLPSSHQHTQYLLNWIREIKKSIPQKEVPVPEIPIEEETESPPSEAPSSEVTPTAPQVEMSAPKPPPLSPLQESLLSSEQMKALIAKLELFGALMEERNFKKGALVSSDIRKTIETFSPVAFFPKLFTEYFALMAKHINALSEEWENEGSPMWESLLQLMHADLEAFVEW